jgi:hypothetical protein
LPNSGAVAVEGTCSKAALLMNVVDPAVAAVTVCPQSWILGELPAGQDGLKLGIHVPVAGLVAVHVEEDDSVIAKGEPEYI